VRPPIDPRKFLLGIVCVCGVIASCANAHDDRDRIAAAVPEQTAVSSALECCKVCSKGKACGDSCIARSRACHKPPGCACDGE
jgi:hypothetical protein